MRVEILESSKGKWYWRIVAKNNKILAHSEIYSSKAKAKKTWKKVKQAIESKDVKLKKE